MISQVEEVKQKTDLVELIGSYIRLDRAGRNYKGLCPFHNERSPSFMVNPDRGTWRCFGCGEHGDAISFLEKHDNLTFIEALEQLANKAGVVLIRDPQMDKRAGRKQRLFELMDLATEYYGYLLREHALGAEARAYLQKRQIDEDLAKKYRLGYAPASWQSLVTYLTKKGFSLEELAEAGMVSVNNGGRRYDRFRNRLMFTVTDTMGRVVGFSGRALSAEDEAKYLNSPDGPLFHKGRLLYGLEQAREAIRAQNRAILVEGNVDVLSVHRAGTREVVAPLGTALTEEQVKLLARYTENVVVAFDRDKAGQEAIRKAIDLLRRADMNIKIVTLKGGSDPDEVVSKDPQLWLKLVEEAVEVVDFYIAWVGGQFDLATDKGKGQAADVLLPLFILNNHNQQRETLMYNRISRALGLDEGALRRQAREIYREVVRGNKTTPDVPKEAKAVEKPKKKGQIEILGEYLLSLLLGVAEGGVEELKEILEVPEKALVDGDRPLLIEAKRLIEGGQFSLAAWYEAAGAEGEVRLDELGSLSSKALLTTSGTMGLVEDVKMASLADKLHELRQVIREIRRLSLKKQLDELSRSLKQAELLDKTRVLDLQRRHIELSQQLAQLNKAG